MIRTTRKQLWTALLRRLACSLLFSGMLCGLTSALAEDSPPLPELTASQQERLKESRALWMQGSDLLEAGKIAEAIAVEEKVLAIEREIFGNEHDRVTGVLALLAELHEVQDDFESAKKVRTESLAALTRRFGQAHWRVTDTRIALEDMIRRSRMSRGDRNVLAAARSASEKMGDLYRQGLFAEALEEASFVNECHRQLLGTQHPIYAKSLSNLALMHESLGGYDQAERLYRQALDIIKPTLGEQHPAYATGLNNLAALCEVVGDFAQAERLFRQTLELRKQSLGEEDSDYATTLNNLAVHYDHLGDFDKADPLYRQAVEVKKRTVGEQHPEFASCLGNLARHLHWSGDIAQAEPMLRRVVELRKQSPGELSPDYAGSLNNLALFYDSQGDDAKAEPLFRQSMEIWKQTLGEQHPHYALSLSHLADLYRARGEYAEAEPLYRRALEIWQRSLGERHPDCAAGLSRLSRILLFQGKAEEALPLTRQATEIDRINLEAVALIQSDRQQFLAAKQSRVAIDTLVTIAVSGGKSATAEYNEVLQAKGRIWQRQLTARAMALAAADKPELAKLIGELRSLAARRAKLTLAVPEVKDQDAWRKQLAELADQQEDRERELSEKSAAIRAARQPVTPDDIRRELPEGTVLIDVFEYSHFLSDPAQRPSVTQERRLAAFIIRRDVPDVTLVALGAVQPLSEAIDTWRQSFGELPAAQAAGRLLRQKIWEPLEPHLNDAKLVLISPDGVLGRFPLAALPGKALGTYLLEEVSLAVVPCAMALPRMLATNSGEQRHKVAGNLLVLANVNYDSTAPVPTTEPTKSFGRFTARRGADWKRFSPLPATPAEMAYIAKLYRDNNKNSDEGITLLEGTQASKVRFCEEATRHEYLHLATHGFFSPPELTEKLRDSAERSRASRVPSDTSPQFLGYPPGFLSGLALAGANRPPSPDQEDGILTASEVENLDLRGVKLAVLSACETGLGEVAGGEGLLGLQRAFQVAGAQSVVASLWEVEDVTTSSLMGRFYENLLKRQEKQENLMSKLDALRQAQLWMLLENRDRGMTRIDPPQPANELKRASPRHWAAFVLSGDWR